MICTNQTRLQGRLSYSRRIRVHDTFPRLEIKILNRVRSMGGADPLVVPQVTWIEEYTY